MAHLFIRRGVVEHCKGKGKELHIFDSDISKAFDSVHFWPLEQALKTLGMPINPRSGVEDFAKIGKNSVGHPAHPV